MFNRSNLPKEPTRSRVQSTRHLSRGFRQPSTSILSATAVKLGVEVYDGVEAANRAGLPMPSQFG